jgi:hypothetical protein
LSSVVAFVVQDAFLMYHTPEPRLLNLASAAAMAALMTGSEPPFRLRTAATY